MTETNYERLMFNRMIPISVDWDFDKIYFIDLDKNEQKNRVIGDYILDDTNGNCEMYNLLYRDVIYRDISLSMIFFKDHKKLSPRRMALIRRFVLIDGVFTLDQLSEVLNVVNEDENYSKTVDLIRSYFHRMNRLYKILCNNKGEIPIESLYYEEKRRGES